MGRFGFDGINLPVLEFAIGNLLDGLNGLFLYTLV